MKSIIVRPYQVFLMAAFVVTWTPEVLSEWPDITSVPTDLTPPSMQVAQPAPGQRVRMTLAEYRESDVYHSLYLPAEWTPDGRYPVIVEYAGNGPFRNAIGDTCSGKVEDCNLGYGIGGGRDFIWLCLPYISEDHTHNQLQWWGDVEATVDYCKQAVSLVCQDYGGDRGKVILAGFSRGSIACNYIGLHDDEIASLWLAFVCHSHYDGVRSWNYPGSDRPSAAVRLKRLRGRPQFISHEQSVDATKTYLEQVCPDGNFLFQPIGFRNHTDQWVLRDIPPRQVLRDWIARVLQDAKLGAGNR